MGNDTPLACLSTMQPLVYEYFKQLFAQVRIWEFEGIFSCSTSISSKDMIKTLNRFVILWSKIRLFWEEGPPIEIPTQGLFTVCLL